MARYSNSSSVDQYPRTYEIDANARRFNRALAICLLSIAVIGTVGQLMGFVHRSLSLAGLLVVDTFFTLLALFIWMQFSRRVILYRDAITVTSWLGSRTLKTDQIRGRRMVLTGRWRDTPHYIVVPNAQGEHELKLPPWLHTDELFSDWMRAIPQLQK